MPSLAGGRLATVPARPLGKILPRPFTCHFHGRDDFVTVSGEVRDAVRTGKPVVALETTIYTHGLSHA